MEINIIFEKISTNDLNNIINILVQDFKKSDINIIYTKNKLDLIISGIIDLRNFLSHIYYVFKLFSNEIIRIKILKDGENLYFFRENLTYLKEKNI
jgi:hypothetical protein